MTTEEIIMAATNCVNAGCEACYFCNDYRCEEEIIVMLIDELKRIKAERDDLSDRHWLECWQIAEYDNDLRNRG